MLLNIEPWIGNPAPEPLDQCFKQGLTIKLDPQVAASYCFLHW